MRIVVTGGAGFIGAHLARRLVDDDRVESVTVLDDLSTGSLHNLSGVDAHFVPGSVTDGTVLDRCMDGVEAVVHLAARPSVPRSVKDPVATHLVNATGTLQVLEAVRRRRRVRVVVASSSSVYGATPTLPKVESLATRPLSPYAASKLASESYALAWQSTYGIPVLALRFFNVFGPLQPAGHAYAAVIPAFIDAVLRGEPVTVHGDGQQSRDFTYVDTVTEILATAAVDGVSDPDPVNLAFGTRTDLLGVLALLEEIFGHPIERVLADPRTGDVRHSQADGSRLRELFPAVTPTELRTGLARTVEWFRTI